jgi:quercetin dioxygenase-like cupin family protein
LAFRAVRNSRDTPPSSPAIVEIIEGQVRFTLDGEERGLASGSWVYMQANLPHAVYARTDAVMLLTLLL